MQVFNVTNIDLTASYCNEDVACQASEFVKQRPACHSLDNDLQLMRTGMDSSLQLQVFTLNKSEINREKKQP